MTINAHMNGETKAFSIHVVLVDNVLLTQEALALVLQNRDKDLNVSVVANSKEITESPDVILVNGKSHELTDADIINEATHIRETWPTVPRLIILERTLPANTALEALRMGWHGYFPANERLELLIMAIRIVKLGGIFVPSELGNYLRSEPKSGV